MTSKMEDVVEALVEALKKEGFRVKREQWKGKSKVVSEGIIACKEVDDGIWVAVTYYYTTKRGKRFEECRVEAKRWPIWHVVPVDAPRSAEAVMEAVTKAVEEVKAKLQALQRVAGEVEEGLKALGFDVSKHEASIEASRGLRSGELEGGVRVHADAESAILTMQLSTKPDSAAKLVEVARKLVEVVEATSS